MPLRTYATYFLTLLAAIIVYYGFAVTSLVASSVDRLPEVSFLASICHFGVNSWLFFWFNKLGRILALLTAAGISLWPTAGVVSGIAHQELDALFYFLPVLVCIITAYLHIRFFNQPAAARNIITMSVLSILPLGLAAYAGWFVF